MRRNRKKKRVRLRVRNGPKRSSPQQHDPVPTHESQSHGGVRRMMKFALQTVEVVSKMESVFKAVHVVRKVWDLVSRANFSTNHRDHSFEETSHAIAATSA